MTPHIEVTPHADGVHLRLKTCEIVLPPTMAQEVAVLLQITADKVRTAGVSPAPLPVVKPKGDPL